MSVEYKEHYKYDIFYVNLGTLSGWAYNAFRKGENYAFSYNNFNCLFNCVNAAVAEAKKAIDEDWLFCNKPSVGI